MRKQFAKQNKGFILLVVLSILAAMVMMVISLVETVETERQLSIDYHNKVRSRMLAQSGVAYASAVLGRNAYDKSSIEGLDVKVGKGSFIVEGDGFLLSAQDTTGMININDGIEAGLAESTTDELSEPWVYEPNQLDPWHEGTGVTIDESIPQVDKSGLLNLRIRRLLNAYGYAHKYKDKVDYDGGGTSNLGGFEFTANATNNDGETAASGDRGVSAPYDENALGDVIIHNRLSTSGYDNLKEITNIVNTWATDNLSTNYVSDAGFGTFFDMVTGDLTVRSYEDTNFFRLRTEIAATADLTVGGGMYPNPVSDKFIAKDLHTSNKEFPCMWWYQNDFTSPSFHPNYLDIHPIDLTDNSGDLTFNTDGEQNIAERNMWLNHSVALINLNSASDMVRAAIFYAPVNVSYLCESAVTHSMKVREQAANPGWGALGGPKARQPELPSIDEYDLNWNNRSDKGNARNSIGVRGPHFQEDRMTEGGNSTTSHVQKNRFMSLRDAMQLAEFYGVITNLVGQPQEPPYGINNFDDFKKLLTHYRKSKRKELGLDDLDKPVYERAEVIPLEQVSANVYRIKFLDAGNITREDKIIQYRDSTSKEKRYIRATFMDEDNPDDTEPMWVSQFWPVEQNRNTYRDRANKAKWEGGWFLEDYVERTLPHIFSCVRRIPGYLGAPMALTSPYMAIEPYSLISPYDNGITRMDDLRRSPFIRGRSLEIKSLKGAFASMKSYMGRLPKVSVEDFVTRHTLPKICFLSNGYYDVKSVGYLKARKNRTVAQTTITTLMQTFNTKYYRTQADFVKLLNRDSQGKILFSDDPEQGNESHTGLVIGPEFKYNNKPLTEGSMSPNDYQEGDEIDLEDRVTSKYLASVGIIDGNSHSNSRTAKDIDGLPAGHGAVKAWDIFLEGDPRDIEGGLNMSPTVPTMLPSYGTDDWHAMTMIDPRRSHSGSGKLFTPSFNNYLIGACDVWYGGFNKSSSGDVLGEGNLPTADLSSLYKPSAYEDVRSRINRSGEFARKWQSRMFVPRGSSLNSEEESGDMENARDNLWAKRDGHDNDLFSSGIFFGSSGNGEFADKYMNPYDRPKAEKNSERENYPYIGEPEYRDGRYYPKNYRDTMYWNLNNKLKNFTTEARVSGNKVDLSNNDRNSNGIMDVYDFNHSFSIYDGDKGDTNPAGVSFHRGFMAAWFRIPTSYPFAHSTGNFYQTHHKLHKTIMNLHVLNMVSSDGDDNDTKVLPYARKPNPDPNPYFLDPAYPEPDGVIYPSFEQPTAFFELGEGGSNGRNNYGVRFSKFYPTYLGLYSWGKRMNSARDDKDGLTASKRIAPYTMHHEIDINVGYYSGFDDDNEFGFEHGIVGYYEPSFVWGGVGARGLGSTRHYGTDSRGLDGQSGKRSFMHPFMMAGLTSARDGFGYDDPSDRPDDFDPHFGTDLHPRRHETMQVIGKETAGGLNPYYGNVHGATYDYDHMLPTPFDFRGWSKLRKYISDTAGGGATSTPIVHGYNHRHDANHSPHDMPTPLKGGANEIGNEVGYYAPAWLANVSTADMGMPVHYATDTTRFNRDAYPGNANRLFVPPAAEDDPSNAGHPRGKMKNLIYGPTNCRNVPFLYGLWKQYDLSVNKRNIIETMAYRDAQIEDESSVPSAHMMVSSHLDYQLFQSTKTTIEHKLPMNLSAECAPGSWHRVYMFWFMRFNPGNMRDPGAGGVEQGDDRTYSNSTYWQNGGDRIFDERFASSQSKYADFQEPANDVDGLDQFGIWFRDDSNYTELFEKVGRGGNIDKSLIKPRFRVYRMTHDEHNTWGEMPAQDDWNNSNPRDRTPDGIPDVDDDGDIIWGTSRDGKNYDHMYNTSHMHPNIHLSVGSTHTGYDFRKGFDRFTGEGYLFGYRDSQRYFHDYDALRRRYPAHIFNSTIDDVIFGYGPDISNRGTFDGLFHNATWLADKNTDVNDEVRYDIDPEDSKKQPQLVFDPLNDDDIPSGSSIVHVGARIYHPRDSGNDHDNNGVPERYNYSELRLDVIEDGNKLVDVPVSNQTSKYNCSSKNNQDHFFNDLSVAFHKPVTIQLKYTGYQRRYDDTYETVVNNAVITESLYRNFGQSMGGAEYEFEGGDSFTNLSHMQELSIRYRKSGGVRYFNWEE